MRLAASLEEARAAGRRRHSTTTRFRGHADVLFETPGDGSAGPPGPQAFLVWQEADQVVPVHFHLQDQFQLVIDGDGTMGRHALIPFVLHFSYRMNGYGPITAGPQPLQYFTLRPVSEQGAHYLPEERALMQPGARRGHVIVNLPAEGSGPGTHVEIAPRADGLAAWTQGAPDGATLRTPDTSGRNRCHVVLHGTFTLDGAPLPRFACVYTSGDEPPLELVASAAHAEIATLQFPD